MNCKHLLAPHCYDCNGGDRTVFPKPVRTDYRPHHYDLLEPETARVILGEVKVAVPLPPSGNGCPSEMDYELALDASFWAVEESSWECEGCSEARMDDVDDETVYEMHEQHLLPAPRPPATQILHRADRKAMMADIGQYV